MKKLRVEDIDVDDIWRALGPLGKYQCKYLLSFLFILVSWAIHQLTIVFIGYRPSFHCKASSNDTLVTNITNEEKVYKECEIITYENTSNGMVKSSASCINGWEYDISVDQSFVTEWDFVCENAELAELTQTLMFIGMMIGNFIFPTISDRVGRKPVLVLSHIAVFGTVLGTAFSANYVVFVVLRILTGFLTQGLLAGTSLSLENLPAEIRHYSEVFALFIWTSGIVLMAPIAYALRKVPWRYLQIAYALMSATSLFQWWITDESLRWVLANGKVEKAKELIKKACKLNNKSYEEVLSAVGLGHIESDSPEGDATEADQMITDTYYTTGSEDIDKNGAVENGNIDLKIEAQSYNLLDIMKNISVLKISLIIWYIWVCDSLVYYGLFMISSDLYGDRYLNFFLSAVIEYPACLFEFICLARIGRKWTCLICHFVAAVALVVATALTYTAGNSASLLATGTAFTLIGKMGITGAFSTVYLMTPELYPTNVRTTGLGVASIMGKIGAMIAPFSRNISHSIKWLPACIYAVMCIVTVVLLAFVPETNGVELPQTMEELAEWYRGNKFEMKIGKNVHVDQSGKEKKKEID
ncbi:solute carrier family 22 member 7-like [Mercenaria mercenaria]|uniref:solute carrier family 22 member 7-like n=1 Tax=Mercenaria mercenaria TaxID=6596 RepID=UPI00234E417C|nr:solute carrier family 22 member 7-like [Mercenaria mercenaria]